MWYIYISPLVWVSKVFQNIFILLGLCADSIITTHIFHAKPLSSYIKFYLKYFLQFKSSKYQFCFVFIENETATLKTLIFVVRYFGQKYTVLLCKFVHAKVYHFEEILQNETDCDIYFPRIFTE